MPESSRIVAIDPIPGGAIVTGHRDEDGVLHIDGVQPFDREALAAWVVSFTEKMRPVMEAMRAQFEAICTTLRPLAECLAELHEQYPDPADWVIEPEPEGCRHLCGRTPGHECRGEADGTFAYREGGHEIPMCGPCQDATTRDTTVRREITLQLTREPAEDRTDYGTPLTAEDADWPAQGSTCAHICGAEPDHACDARATTRLTYSLPSGGMRSMPICGPCYESETGALAAPASAPREPESESGYGPQARASRRYADADGYLNGITRIINEMTGETVTLPEPIRVHLRDLDRIIGEYQDRFLAEYVIHGTTRGPHGAWLNGDMPHA